MVLGYIMTALLAFLAGRLVQKKEHQSLSDRLLVGGPILGILIFVYQGYGPIGLICAAAPAFAFGLFTKKVEWTIVFFTLASGVISYYSDSALSALVFAGTAGFLVRMLWKNKKKGVAIALVAVTFVTTIVLMLP